MDNNENNGNVNGRKEILNIMLNETNVFFTNFNNLHSKAAALIAFYGAIIMFAIDKDFLIIGKHDTTYEIMGIILKHIIFILILGLSVASIILCLKVLMSGKKARFGAENISDNALNKGEIDIITQEIQSYKEILKENNKLLKRKHKDFNASIILTIIQISVIAFNMVVYMIENIGGK